MKRILFFINTLAGGGAERVLINLLTALDPQEYRIDLVTVSGGANESRLPASVNYRSVCPGNGGLMRKIVYHLSPKVFNFLFLRGKYDIKIAYLEGFPTKVIACSKNAKKIAFVHCDVSVKPVLQNFYKSHERCIADYSKFDKVCFVSQMALCGFENTFGHIENAEVVHNVINTKEIISKACEKTDFSFNTQGLKIISVGRLSPEKGFERLIRIVSELEKKYDFELCILGDGPEREKLEELIKELNIRSVRLLGFQTNPYCYMAKADLYVCSSYFEGYSTTVTECVILGIPVLTTDCAGMDEILNNGENGIIVDNNDNTLKEGLVGVLENPELYIKLKEDALNISNGGRKDNAIAEYEKLLGEL